MTDKVQKSSAPVQRPSAPVLSISLRPSNLDEIVGQDEIVRALKAQFESGRIPHFFLITGPPGSGKTSIARIIAVMLQHEDPLDPENEDLPLSKYDIKEINASDKNGVDDIRELLETIRYKPHLPSLAKVYILDEAHQLTNAAQNALLKDTEDTPNHVFFIFCTNNDSKILPTLKRRSYTINTHGISKEAAHKLLLNAKKKAGFKSELKDLEDTLVEHEIDTPGLILKAAEKYFSGASALDSIFGSGSEGAIDTKKLCQVLLKGDWKSASPILKTITKDDIVMVRNCILGYFKAVLFNTGSVKLAQAMKIIGEEVFDLPSFLANIAIACETLKKTTA